MYEVRWHGRGGQGGFTAARLLGMAASVHEGKYSLAFPSFGPERRGAPVLGFTRISDKKITDRSQVDECDYVVFLDETLVGETTLLGLKDDAFILINTADPEKYSTMTDKQIVALDATSLSLEVLGRPITNTAMLGALVALSGVVSLEALKKAIQDGMKSSLVEKNCTIVEKAFNMVKGAVNNG